MSFCWRTPEGYFICFTAAGTNRDRGGEGKKEMKGELPGIERKRGVEKQNRGLCSAVSVALLPLRCLAELR